MDNGDDGNGIGSVVANNFAFAGCVGSGNEHTEGGDTDTAASRWTFVDLNICFPRLVNATATVDAEGAPPSAPLPLLAMPPQYQHELRRMENNFYCMMITHM